MYEVQSMHVRQAPQHLQRGVCYSNQTTQLSIFSLMQPWGHFPGVEVVMRLLQALTDR